MRSGDRRPPGVADRDRSRQIAPIAERVQALRAELRSTALELLAALYPKAARRRVSAHEIRACGFDPDSRAPDPDDYW